MVAPTAESDVVLNGLVLLRPDTYLPVASTDSTLWWAWTETFNPIPPVQLATNDVSNVYQAGVRPGGDMAQERRYTFELVAAWETDAGLEDLMTDLATVSAPLQTGTATLSFMLAGVVWTATGRFEPISMTRILPAQKFGTWSVRFRATDPVLAGDGAQQLL